MIGLFSFFLSDLPPMLGYDKGLQDIGNLERVTKPLHTFSTAIIYSAFLPILNRWFKINMKTMVAKEYAIGLTLGSIYFLVINEMAGFLTRTPVEPRHSLFSSTAYAKLGPQKFFTTWLRLPLGRST